MTETATSLALYERSDCPSLDLLSTSQTNLSERSEDSMRNDLCSVPKIDTIICHNYAPYFAVATSDTGKSFYLWQGNCNDWTCPRCGQLRAKKEYGRIVEGCRTLAVDNEIFFITLTCKGANLSIQDAEDNYLAWTNKLLTACRAQAKRANLSWHYVQVTERQKRGHPHSHVLITWQPKDTYLGEKEDWKTMPDGRRRKKMTPALRSNWFEKRCISAGLGNQYDISKVDTIEGASRYVAKYLFKESMFSTQWAKNWRRVRYSQSFPKLAKQKGSKEAIPLVTPDDWQAFAKLAVVVKVADGHDYIHLSKRLGKSDAVIQLIERRQYEFDEKI